MVSTSQKISCSVARISSSFENCFLQISIMVSTSSKIALTKKNTVSTRQKIRLHQPGEGCSKIRFHYKEKLLLLQKISEKIEKISVHQQEHGSSLKIHFPLISIIVSASIEKTRNKAILFPADEKLVSTFWHERLAEKCAPVKGKTASTSSS